MFSHRKRILRILSFVIGTGMIVFNDRFLVSTLGKDLATSLAMGLGFGFIIFSSINDKSSSNSLQILVLCFFIVPFTSVGFCTISDKLPVARWLQLIILWGIIGLFYFFNKRAERAK